MWGLQNEFRNVIDSIDNTFVNYIINETDSISFLF